MTQKLLISGATVVISFLSTVLGNLAIDWVREVNTDRRDQAKYIIQLQERAHYVSGDIAAVPVSTPTERLKAAAAESK